MYGSKMLMINTKKIQFIYGWIKKHKIESGRNNHEFCNKYLKT
jgi:hypothetical protein